jgi:ADP-ribose pyrophosphatase YjhB (NUDIX family)
VLAKIVTKALQRYWRWSRGLTLGAQGCVIDEQNRILLIRHGYRPGWHFPGGGVEYGESALTALKRELEEEAGVVATAEPRLFGIFDNGEKYAGDHVVLYVVRQWTQPRVPPPSKEIAEQGFFHTDQLPDAVSPQTAVRIAEIMGARPRSELW